MDLSKVFVLGFQMLVGTLFRTRDVDLKTKILTYKSNPEAWRWHKIMTLKL